MHDEKPQTNGATRAPPQERKPSVAQSQRGPTSPSTPTFPRTRPQDESKQAKTPPKRDSRRASWFSSISSKLSSDKHGRSGSTDSAASKKSPAPSPALEKSNPFEAKRNGSQDIPPEEKPVHVGPRRPSVLVAAGTETKLDSNPGFLSSALRRLSSSNTAHMGKAPATTGALCPRKVMSIDQNRQRTKITDFDQNRLRRVAFKVDVEIAGIAAQADEQNDQDAAASSASAAASGSPPAGTSKEAKMAKYKDRSEGATLKKSTSREEKTDTQPEKSADSEAKLEAQEDGKKARVEEAVKQEEEDAAEPDVEEKSADGSSAPSTRRKEKKKRSEAERKERKERKRRQAELNGLIPLELTVAGDDDSDDSTNTPAGASTPKKGQPTTDPLRIYKRCCQLRETTALAILKEQISKPSAVLAEAPGTVASIDLTGTEMSLQDIQTLGDWLAVVPVRRLILDDCNLSDEGIRIVLSGLSGCKSQEQAKANRKLPSRASGKAGVEQMGVIEKLSLKNSTAISVIGWRHIALFIHMSQSLRAIDLSGIPFPSTADGEMFRTSLTSTNLNSAPEPAHRRIDLSTLFARALAERFGGRLEELILSDCGLSSYGAIEIMESVIRCKIKRLGIANNNLDRSALSTVVKYITSDICEGLDYGGNDLHGTGHLLTEVLDDQNPLFAMSLAGCNLGVDEVRQILQHLTVLKNFKFIDLSRNPQLFAAPDGVALLRRRLPQMKELKRIHLSDVNMTPNQIISLSEIFPDCPSLAHVSILDNQRLVECMNSKQGEAQEEACAVFVSLMTAVRASNTLVAVEIEVPSQESSEVIKALASQVVAYSLRNLERSTLPDIGIQQDAGAAERGEKGPPEVLLNVIGHMKGYPQNHDNDEPAPDDDYVIASTGIVKALGVCLGNSKSASRNMSPSASGTATPKSGHLRPPGGKKPKDVSLELCESARKIRMRLGPAMIKEDQAGNVEAYRKFPNPPFNLLHANHRNRSSYVPRPNPRTHDQAIRRRVPRIQTQARTRSTLSRIPSLILPRRPIRPNVPHHLPRKWPHPIRGRRRPPDSQRL